MDAGPDDAVDRHELTPCQRKVAIVGWSSFLVASVATMLFFAWIDPASLADVADAPLPTDRMTGYAVGFFFFWAISAAAAALAMYLFCNSRAPGEP
jgi:membrane protein insertase Oxa1/YidC/SpoIIIJ